ncbi:acyltransferase family protein [Kineococcus sp. SYSU DK003]|uniref:acyltransferase family protein n=1 Tax=Kineococcus sp. SYSU DK003 TaxID=3383124 RepID=UPI003D7C46BA
MPDSGAAATTSGASTTRADGPEVRFGWMDLLRALAVLLVIVFHSGTLLRYADVPVPDAVGSLNSAVAPFRIPLLVLLSGALLPRSVAKGASPYLRGKWRAIAWPFLVWTAVYAVLTWPGGLGPVTWYVPDLLRGGSYLWYLFFLLVFYLVALPLRRVPRLPAAAVFLVLSEVAPDDTKYLERPLYLMALFLLGWWVAEDPRRLAAVLRSRRLLVVAALVLVPAVLWAPDAGYGPRATVATLAGAALAAALAARFADAAALRPLRFVGRNSVVFYVAHFPVLYVVMHVVPRFGDFPTPVLVAAAFAAAVAAATVLALLRSRWTVVEWLFTAPRRS